MMRKKYNVAGKVQGVWFRKSTQDKARQLDINGFVRNEPGGSVYLEAEGEEESLRHLEEWLHQGPPEARVEKVDSEELEVVGDTGFQVR